MYLSGSIASFRSGSLQLFQVLFAKCPVKDVPWTRSYLYANPDEVKNLHGSNHNGALPCVSKQTSGTEETSWKRAMS